MHSHAPQFECETDNAEKSFGDSSGVINGSNKHSEDPREATAPGFNRDAVTAQDLAQAQATDDSTDPIERRYLIRKPKAHQWFENDVLMKASDKERVAGKFELFFDLLYVALVANFAEHLAEDPTGINFAIYLIIFTTGWHAWADLKEMMNNYYNDDLIQRFNVLWIMTLLILFGNNANFVAEDILYLRITTGTYQIIRFSQACMFLYNSCGDFRHRIQNRLYVLSEVIVVLLWTPMYFEEVSQVAKLILAFIVIVVEEVGWIVSFGPWIARCLGLTHRSALDIDHENDRYTAFTIIVLGEFTYAILVGSPAKGGLNLGYLRAVLTLIIAFCYNAMYVYEDGSIKCMHPARYTVLTSTIWLMIHLPMSGGLLIAGHVAAASVYEDMNDGRRWLFGGGLALGFASLWIMSHLFRDCDSPGRLLMPKGLRTLPRLMSAIILAILPVTSVEQVDDNALLGIATSLSVFTVIWETYGALEKEACLIESWKEEDGRKGFMTVNWR